VNLRVESHSPEPIFQQLAFQVKSAVARGELEPGDKLPSVRELAKDLAINPNTVARAYEALERDGVIVRKQGSGCFVSGEASTLKLDERRRRLDQLAHRLVTEAFHLGLDGDDVRTALERQLRRQTPAGKKS
jgi:GntR family transcriptional regulator